jgi:hypothetical protein
MMPSHWYPFSIIAVALREGSSALEAGYLHSLVVSIQSQQSRPCVRSTVVSTSSDLRRRARVGAQTTRLIISGAPSPCDSKNSGIRKSHTRSPSSFGTISVCPRTLARQVHAINTHHGYMVRIDGDGRHNSRTEFPRLFRFGL